MWIFIFWSQKWLIQNVCNGLYSTSSINLLSVWYIKLLTMRNIYLYDFGLTIKNVHQLLSWNVKFWEWQSGMNHALKQNFILHCLVWFLIISFFLSMKHQRRFECWQELAIKRMTMQVSSNSWLKPTDTHEQSTHYYIN